MLYWCNHCGTSSIELIHTCGKQCRIQFMNDYEKQSLMYLYQQLATYPYVKSSHSVIPSITLHQLLDMGAITIKNGKVYRNNHSIWLELWIHDVMDVKYIDKSANTTKQLYF